MKKIDLVDISVARMKNAIMLLLVLAFITLCGCNTTCKVQTEKPSALVALLSNQNSVSRAKAAKELRQLIAADSSSKTNEYGKDYWMKRAKSVNPGMKHSEVIKLLPPYRYEMSGLSSGSCHIRIWRLDHYWMVTVYYNRLDKVTGTPKLKNKTMHVWVKPLNNFTGTWETWYVNGQKSHKIEYVNGKYNGVFIIFDDKGHKSCQQHYKAGVGSGSDSGWYPDGRNMYQGNYIDGKQSGTWTHWFPDGSIRSRCGYKNGKQDGAWAIWYSNGKMRSEVCYRNGKKNGIDKEWDKNGKLLWSRHYINGKLTPDNKDTKYQQ